jgi:hypothetical protein
LVSEIDMAALGTLPSNLNPTLLLNQRSLGRRVTRILLASNNRHFCIAHGKHRIYAYGAKAFSSVPEFANGTGMRVSLAPVQEPLPTLTDTDEKEISDDFQARLLRFRLVNYRQVSEAQPDTRNFVPAMREEIRAWLAPLWNHPELQGLVSNVLRQQSREVEGARLADDRCVVAEAALYFCHKPEVEHFFIGDVAEIVNTLFKGRHEDRVLSDKKAGLILRSLGIRGERVVQGYRILLTDTLRQQIHEIARGYQVLSVQDGVVRCSHCKTDKVGVTTN